VRDDTAFAFRRTKKLTGCARREPVYQ
jgi:hypothetical protein